MMLLQPE
jgi:dynein heavy chain 1